MILGVEWREIPGFPGYYACSDGSVWSRRNEHKYGPRPLRPGTNKAGYRTLNLVRDGHSFWRYVHSAVCHAFHGNPPSPKHEVRHLDGNKSNNAPDNLQWGTRRENIDDSIRLDAIPKGSGHWSTKLTEDQVAMIRSATPRIGSRSGGTIKELAQSMGIHPNHASAIRRRLAWKHIKG